MIRGCTVKNCSSLLQTSGTMLQVIPWFSAGEEPSRDIYSVNEVARGGYHLPVYFHYVGEQLIAFCLKIPPAKILI